MFFIRLLNIFLLADYRASLKTHLVKEKTDRCSRGKESPRSSADALQEGSTQHMLRIAVFSQKGFLEMPYNIIPKYSIYFNTHNQLKFSSFLCTLHKA